MTPEERARRGNFERLTIMVTIEGNGQARVRIDHKDRCTDYRDPKTVHEKRYGRLEGDPRVTLERLIDVAEDGLADYSFDVKTRGGQYRA